MPTKEIVRYPEHTDILRRRSAPVARMTNRVKELIEDLKDTLHAHPEGIGLAAPQIGAHLRVVVVRLGGGAESESEPGPPMALVNPEIVEPRDRRRDFDGCLSLPGLYGETTRPHHLRVTGLDEQGRPLDQTFEGFDAVVIHHELDHLDGVLFIDRVESLDDLYRVRDTEDGELVRVPLSQTSQERTRQGLTLDSLSG